MTSLLATRAMPSNPSTCFALPVLCRVANAGVWDLPLLWVPVLSVQPLGSSPLRASNSF